MRRVLIAGIGNVFHGDDGFGAEVARQLREIPLPQGVDAIDFGIRGHDLAYAVADGYDAVVFVDAIGRGGKPGTLYMLELDLNNLERSATALNGHSLDPSAVLHMVRLFNAPVGCLYLVGCEPATLESEDGELKLSAEVAGAVPQALEMIRSLLNDLIEDGSKLNYNLAWLKP